MALTDALDRYFAAWNDHDPEAVVASLTDGGTYEDPTTGGPLSGDALARSVQGLITGFPDVRFEIVSVAPTSETTAAAQWRMIGTNTGPMPAGPATNGAVDLPGADFVTYDAAADRLTSVIGYFDTATMLTQLGLQAHITPLDMDPFVKFGTSNRVDTGRAVQPAAFSITWIEIEPENEMKLIDKTTEIVMELLGNDGYLGSCFARIGKRNYTMTAWASIETAREALRGGKHAEAMRMARKGEFGDTARGLVSLWSREHAVGPYTLVDLAGRENTELDGQWL